MQHQQTTAGFLSVYDFESKTVSTSAVGMDTGKIGGNLAKEGKVRAVFITCETSRVRYRLDGSAPTATVGHELFPGQSLTLANYQQIVDFKAIRHSGDSSDATLRISYQR